MRRAFALARRCIGFACVGATWAGSAWADGAHVDGPRTDGARVDGANVDGARTDGARVDGAHAGSARATRRELVVLLPPPQSEPLLAEAFVQLAGELAAHDFEGVLLPPSTSDDLATLESAARRSDAMAGVALHRTADGSAVDVWLLDRVTGKLSRRTIAVGGVADAARLLAIRTVDLLRASLAELRFVPQPPRAVVGARRRPVPPAATRLVPREPPSAAASTGFRLRVGAAAQVDGRVGFGAGPALALSAPLSRRLELALASAGPALGQRFDGTLGAASLRSTSVRVELDLWLHDERPWRLGVAVATGALLVAAEGRPNAPRQGLSTQGYFLTAALGVRAALALTEQLALIGALWALSTWPRIGVAVAEEATVLWPVTPQSELGLEVRF